MSISLSTKNRRDSNIFWWTRTLPRACVAVTSRMDSKSGVKPGQGASATVQDGAIDERIDFIVLLGGDERSLTALELDAHALEHPRDLTEVVLDILDGQLALGHGRHADEAPDFDHVREASVVAAPSDSTPSMVRRFDPTPEILPPMRLIILHSCCR